MTQKTSAFRRLLLAGGFAATFAAGGLVLPAAASAMQDAMEAHAGMDHAGMHAMIQAHVARMLVVAQASPEQKARIHEILMGAMHQIGPLHQKLAASHQDLHRILTAPTVDRTALEQLRTERMADADQASRVLVQALADAAEVLTPEQRAKLATAEHGHAAHPQP